MNQDPSKHAVPREPSGEAAGAAPLEGELVVFPAAADPAVAGDAEEIPAELRAWLDHARQASDLEARLAALAHELADSVPRGAAARPAEPRTSSRRVALLAIAASLLCVLAWRAWHPRTVVVAPPPAPVVAAPALPEPMEVAVAVAPAPEPPAPLPAPQAPRPAHLARTLVGRGEEQTVIAGVAVLLDGRLELAGTSRAPRLTLSGSATFDVTPGAVSDLVVESAGAKVRVLGTRFTVAEGATGTRIAVERGKVQTQCVVGAPLVLTAGQEELCPLPNAAGMHIHLRRLERAGASPAVLLEVAEKGLAYPVQQPALHAAFQLARMKALLDLGRRDEARGAIEAYLASGATAFREDIAALGARAGLTP